MEIKSRRDWNLYQKINEIQNGAMEVVKGGKNNFAKYNYKTFTNIKEAVMKKMHDLGVVFLPVFLGDNTDYDGRGMGLNISKDGKATQVSYIQSYQLINADKPDERQTFNFPMIGTNNDGADKANGSATTYGLKYLFNLWGLIPDESLDPDERGEVEKESKQEPKKQQEGYSPLIVDILREVASKSKKGLVLKERIQAMTGMETPNKEAIINGIQRDGKRMDELEKILKGENK